MLADSLRGFDHAVLIDAIKPDISNTSLKWVNIHKIKSRGSLLSSHEIGVTESLEWINSLESLPDDIALLGVSSIEPSQLTDIILSCIEYEPKE